jgi:hypothetical protein
VLVVLDKFSDEIAKRFEHEVLSAPGDHWGS